MTRTVFFADHALRAGTVADKRAQAAPSFMARKSPEAGRVTASAAMASTGSKRDQAMKVYPWLTVAMCQSMSVRARRLMRLGY